MVLRRWNSQVEIACTDKSDNRQLYLHSRRFVDRIMAALQDWLIGVLAMPPADWPVVPLVALGTGSVASQFQMLPRSSFWSIGPLLIERT